MLTNVSEEHVAFIFRVNVLYPEAKSDTFLVNFNNHAEDYNPAEELVCGQ
jgi:hypothetical protein